MNVLGIDPGSAHVGVAVVGFDECGNASWLHADEVRPEQVTRDWLATLCHSFQIGRVAVELPKPRAVGALRQLVATAECAGYVRGLADSLSLDPLRLTSYEWRKRLCGNSNAKGNLIRFALEEHLEVPRSNDHKRDAAGVALVAGWEIYFGRLVA